MRWVSWVSESTQLDSAFAPDIQHYPFNIATICQKINSFAPPPVVMSSPNSQAARASRGPPRSGTRRSPRYQAQPISFTSATITDMAGARRLSGLGNVSRSLRFPRPTLT